MKQVIIVRADLKLTRGKMAAQVAHASVESVLRSSTTAVKRWREEGMKKIVLKVADLSSLHTYHQRAKDAGIMTALITDGGHTHLEPGTVTCLGIGPDTDEKIDRATSDLKLYN